jgi:hypothetical protein
MARLRISDSDPSVGGASRADTELPAHIADLLVREPRQGHRLAEEVLNVARGERAPRAPYVPQWRLTSSWAFQACSHSWTITDSATS